MKRLLLRFGFALLVVAVAFGLFLWFFGPEERITRANCNRIRPGMSEAQVEELLGRPGVPSARSDGLTRKSGEEAPAGAKQTSWRGVDSMIVVLFDKENRVIEANCSTFHVGETFWQRIRRRLGF